MSWATMIKGLGNFMSSLGNAGDGLTALAETIGRMENHPGFSYSKTDLIIETVEEGGVDLPYLENTLPGHSKFWTVDQFKYDKSVQKWVVIVRWGRIGEEGQTQLKSFMHEYQADQFVHSKRNEKLSKGYNSAVKPGSQWTKVPSLDGSPKPASTSKSTTPDVATDAPRRFNIRK